MRSKYNVATEPSPVSGDPSQDYFSNGLTEEMIAQLRLRCATHVGVIASRCRHTLDMDRRFTVARRWLAASLVQWAGWMRELEQLPADRLDPVTIVWIVLERC